MLYTNIKKQHRKQKTQSITKHPYFGFVIIGFLMLLIQVLRGLGVEFEATTLRAFGRTMIYTIVALGFSILLGYAGLASLGTAGLVGVGAYLLGFLTNQYGTSIFIIILLSIIVAIILGLVVGFISLRIEGMYLAIITLAVSQILNEVFKNADSLIADGSQITEITGGNSGLNLVGVTLFGEPILINHNIIFIGIAVIMVLIMILTLNIMKSPTGRAMLAMRNSQSAAQAMGINIFKHRLLAFMISTVYALIAGVLFMSYFSYTVPTQWSLTLSLNLLAAVIVGGSQSIYGVTLGTFMIFGLDLLVYPKLDLFLNNPGLNLVVSGLLIIVVIMFYPGGLIRLFKTTAYKIKQLYKKLKQRWKEYRYGTDSE